VRPVTEPAQADAHPDFAVLADPWNLTLQADG
jgi:hypothetical protein